MIDVETVRRSSAARGEPDWLRALRLRALEAFHDLPVPPYGDPDLLGSIRYDAALGGEGNGGGDGGGARAPAPPTAGAGGALAGAGARAQYESEVVYQGLREEWASQGVVFLDTDEALRERPDLAREHLASAVPPDENKFAALNLAVFSGGSFIYVPPGVQVRVPLQSFFKTAARDHGQFERTVIVVGEGASVHYVEGCTAPVRAVEPLHASVVEIVVRPRGRCQYTTLQNWSKNVLNLVTKRALVHEDATVRWVDANVGARLTVKHPSAHLLGARARGEVYSIAFANRAQHQDAGCEVVHAAPETSSAVVARCIARSGGRSTFRAFVRVRPEARGAKVRSRCDALLLDERAVCETVPYLDVRSGDAAVDHEAQAGRIADQPVFYLGTRGIPEDEARVTIVNGFIQPVVRELPMEYAVELTRLVQIEMDGAGCGR